mmetsp:Transcript_10497/g.31649  ORF Transcript_10497/g.31649 Transcript_10497/m.31649 type:complete len:210 (+) Transcript_10497:909-1538(+)
MIWLKRKEPAGNEWFIPLAGDFHFKIHDLMALHRLWWKALVKWLVIEQGFCAKSCKDEKWDSVEKYNNYLFLYETFIVAIVTCFQSFLPKSHLLSPTLLKELTKENKGARVLVHFLYDFALPWLSLRQAVRGNQAKNIETVWQMSLWWFRVSNKPLYARLCVDTTYVTLSMVPSLLELYRETRCCSLRGNDGRNVEMDFALEVFKGVGL